MIQTRNTLVVVRLLEVNEKAFGNIVLPTQKDQCCEAEIVAVGPGTVSAAGGRSETFDLRVGQRVFVKHKIKARGPMGDTLIPDGIPYQDGDHSYIMLEQGSILGIIASPVGPSSDVAPDPETQN